MKDAANKFINFLKEKGVFEEYKDSLEAARGFDDLNYWIKFADPRDFILVAFYWGHVSEGEKWSAINCKWQDFIKQNGAE